MNGEITVFMEMASSIEIQNFSFKEGSKTASNKDQDATNTKMEMFLKAPISKMKREVMENIILLKEESYKQNSTLCLLKYQQ